LSDEKKANVIDVDSLSMAMRWAASFGYKVIVRLALNNGANVNAYMDLSKASDRSHMVFPLPHSTCGTVLQCASFGMHKSTVISLLKRGAIVDAVSTVLHTHL
jgi:hypothetical protein